MEITNVHKLAIDMMKDLYSAEKQLVEALPKMANTARTEDLKKGFEEHLEQTKEHVRRIEQVGESLEFAPGGKACAGMKGLIDEGSEIISATGESSVIDAALIGAAQKVEHYEIAAYGTLITLLKGMGHNEEADILGKTLEEEKQTNEKLTSVAEGKVNIEALQTVDHSDMEK